MRCAACNVILSDSELGLRAPETLVFADLCYECFEQAFDLTPDPTYNTACDIEEIADEQDGFMGS